MPDAWRVSHLDAPKCEKAVALLHSGGQPATSIISDPFSTLSMCDCEAFPTTVADALILRSTAGRPTNVKRALSFLNDFRKVFLADNNLFLSEHKPLRTSPGGLDSWLHSGREPHHCPLETLPGTMNDNQRLPACGVRSVPDVFEIS